MVSLKSTICQYLGFAFAAFCATPKLAVVKKSVATPFASVFEWTHVNFTWPSTTHYERAIAEGRYVPQHNVITGIKFYKERIYVALARVRPGTPVTLATMSKDGEGRRNALLTPFPTWQMNVQGSCSTLQNVQSMEIDRRGVMWVLDGIRSNAQLTVCPPKLVLFDLNGKNRVVGRFVFGELLASAHGAVLSDLVLDETDGGYAYIADGSDIDPGLIVFARQQARAWKLRDRSMFAEPEVANVTIAGVVFDGLSAIRGVALSPLPTRRDVERIVYFTALSAHNVYAISTNVLQNEKFCLGGTWRQYVKHVGKKTALSDGMLIDNQGNLFFGLIDVYAIAQWNIYQYFDTASLIYSNETEILWPMRFAMDAAGYLYVLCNNWQIFINSRINLTLSDDVHMKVMKLYTGSKNYMFTP